MFQRKIPSRVATIYFAYNLHLASSNNLSRRLFCSTIPFAVSNRIITYPLFLTFLILKVKKMKNASST